LASAAPPSPSTLESSNRLSKNSLVSPNPSLVSVLINTSAAAYTAPKLARLVYQLESTATSPAKNQISSVNAPSSRSDVDTFPKSDISASASGSWCATPASALAWRRAQVRDFTFAPTPAGRRGGVLVASEGAGGLRMWTECAGGEEVGGRVEVAGVFGAEVERGRCKAVGWDMREGGGEDAAFD
ncbi:hypothetical protein V493_07599, partial [Pseudogymnoascus sp. VKM F-4281 (FW-2241)]